MNGGMNDDARRAEFAAVLERIREFGRAAADLGDNAQAMLNAALLADYRARHPKVKEPTLKRAWKEDPNECRALLEVAKQRYDAESKMARDWIDAGNRLAFDIAQELTPRAGAERHLSHAAWFGTYRSQGFGQDRYTIAEAESHADQARAFNIPVEVTPSEDGMSLNVHVHVESDLDVEILIRRPLSLREQVRLFWKRGVNPRVYMPFLPYGYEEKQGLDYHGNEKGGAA